MQVHLRLTGPVDASMKALPERKGNAVPALQFLKSETASMKVPTKR